MQESLEFSLVSRLTFVGTPTCSSRRKIRCVAMLARQHFRQLRWID
jgi:hypothetical protein